MLRNTLGTGSYFGRKEILMGVAPIALKEAKKAGYSMTGDVCPCGETWADFQSFHLEQRTGVNAFYNQSGYER